MNATLTDRYIDAAMRTVPEKQRPDLVRRAPRLDRRPDRCAHRRRRAARGGRARRADRARRSRQARRRLHRSAAAPHRSALLPRLVAPAEAAAVDRPRVRRVRHRAGSDPRRRDVRRGRRLDRRRHHRRRRPCLLLGRRSCSRSSSAAPATPRREAQGARQRRAVGAVESRSASRAARIRRETARPHRVARLPRARRGRDPLGPPHRLRARLGPVVPRSRALAGVDRRTLRPHGARRACSPSSSTAPADGPSRSPSRTPCWRSPSPLPALWLLAQGRLLNPEFFPTLVPEDGAEVAQIIAVLAGFGIAIIAVWDIIDGFLKARRAR